jgi:hypothetical protein
MNLTNRSFPFLLCLCEFFMTFKKQCKRLQNITNFTKGFKSLNFFYKTLLYNQLLKGFETNCKTYIWKFAKFKTFFTNFTLITHLNKRLQNLLNFLKHCKSILKVTKYYTNLYKNKKVKERLNNNMNNSIKFHKNYYYNVNFAVTNFVL